MKRREFIIGDIHGGYRALIQVLERSGFDYENDLLISLGDLADGWSETHLVIEELMKIKNFILIKGNHDDWAMTALITDMGKRQRHLSQHEDIEVPEYLIKKYNRPKFFMREGEGRVWYQHGGLGTEFSYKNNPHLIVSHVEFLDKALDYYIDEKNRFFAHSGPDPFATVEESNPRRFYWNREFWSYTLSSNLTHKKYREHLDRFDEIYIGHTPTTGIDIEGFDNTAPVNVKNVWNMDTGSCFNGKLSIMEINTKEVYQSDVVRELYPNEKGRMRLSYNDDIELGIIPNEIQTENGVWKVTPKKFDPNK